MSALTRRTFLSATALGVLAACTPAVTTAPLVLPTDPRVREVEAARRSTGRTRSITLAATAGQIDLGGTVVDTWTYDGAVPGREIRISAGDVIEARLVNRLPADTSIHWHGVALRNDMDGTPDLTQPGIAAGAEFTYRFIAPVPGTYWFHPHTGTQLDRGLYAPLIVEDPTEPGAYDAEWVVVLDDWIDGTGTTPDQIFADPRQRTGHMGSMPGMGGTVSPLLGDAGDVTYPHYLINGRTPSALTTFTAKPGQRVRIRFINAGSDTAFRVAVGGHRMTVTHTDGFPITPVDTDALLIGMGERYDALVTLSDGVYPVVALAEGKNATAFALARTATGSAPGPEVRPSELTGSIVGYPALKPTIAATLPAKPPDIVHRLALTGGVMSYDWGINGRTGDLTNPARVREGQRVRIEFVNTTMMWHPMHIHGHTFQLGNSGPRKDTAIVLPGQTLACDFDADNPGQWMTHCHNAYHAEAGMMTLLGYQT
ncbi:multicopper oxidase family protein [Kibdelosporangium philippinense]|uniref:Multicopper oxidase family protein n=1 Tax=Kibdelosporangium philippinense TaxID=211113 RepID=A0ABS8Z9S4_9PSEU|nr:multicopper oxidase family protein [Kibdelosporangium philippinense]MCE7004626.1 multicopper oxidase family protein [Kibdelosporangium philippinense]